MAKKLLIVLTSHDQLGDTGAITGFWLEEFAAPYYVFADAGIELTLASPKGGHPPLDPKSDQPDSQTPATERFRQDQAAQAALAETIPLATLKAEDYDGIFYPGGHGPLWDLVDDPDSIRLLGEFWAQGKAVGAVCHGPVVLANAIDLEAQPIVKGRKVTAFSNAEEAAVGLTEIVPVSVEDALKAQGGLYTQADNFSPYHEVDGQLITGQNPASSEPTAEAMLALLN